MSALSRRVGRRIADDLCQCDAGIRRRHVHGRVEVDALRGHAPERDLAIDERRAELARHGGIHALVAAHARSSSGGLGALTAAELDRSYAVNARATLLLVQAAAHAGVRRVVLFITGGHHEAMADEIAYAASKAAVHGITRSLAQALAPHGATVNCINPGPVDTGYADDATRAAVAARMPMKRWGRPRDITPVVAWLLSDEAAWLTGQTLDVDGGWSLRGAAT